ncbi:MAG TPA: tetratricopeptide repeat protein [Flavobacteriaceae bacterium]|nr:tetratricopeptide repeat protein [Flavobacteriaceae bacterium]
MKVIPATNCIFTSKIFFRFSLLFFLFGTAGVFSQQEVALDDRGDYIVEIKKDFENDRWSDGKSLIDNAMKKYPNDADLHMLAGKYYHHVGNQDKARFHLLKSINIFPRNVDAKQILVNVEMEAKRYSSAICYVNELLEVNPYWRGLWRKKIELYRLQGNEIEARRLQKRINQIYPEDSSIRADFLYEMELDAAENYKSGNYEMAIEIQKTLMREDRNNSKHYLGLANSYLQTKDPETALQIVEQGIALDPSNEELIKKKAGILADQRAYDILLPFLLQHNLQSQYNYYLLEAARYSLNNQPYTYYGKIFDRNPGNAEAFEVVYAYNVANQDYNEAMHLLSRHRRALGDSKTLMLKERTLFLLMNNRSRADGITRKLIVLYPEDAEIREAYSLVVLEDAKQKMLEKNYAESIPLWHQVMEYGSEELAYTAQHSLFNAYLEVDAYPQAHDILNAMMVTSPNDPDLHLKRAQIYFLQENYQRALSEYESILKLQTAEKKKWYLIGYAEMASQIIKRAMENYRYRDAMAITDRWLEQDPTNNQALHHAVNLAMHTKPSMAISYAERGRAAYPEDVFFIVKLAQLKGVTAESQVEIADLLKTELDKNPYHPDLINVNAEIAESYSLYLIKNNRNDEALEKLNAALSYAPDNVSLKYAKGLAFEKKKMYDSAYYYQSFYVPHPQEAQDFNRHLDYLDYKQKKNEIGIYHLRSRFGDNYTISTISTVEYSRLSHKNVFTGRINYGGRELGKGYQFQAEWTHNWNLKTYTKIDAAWADKFFPKLVINGSVYRHFENLKDIEIEVGLGFRQLDTTYTDVHLNDTRMYNVVVGATKQWDEFRLNLRVNNFFLDDNHMFNATLSGRYYFLTPKTYVTAMAGAGTSPDVDLLNYQLYNGFKHLNTMVGAGFSHLVYKTVTIGALGTWYNYEVAEDRYRNLYNIYLNMNVAF